MASDDVINLETEHPVYEKHKADWEFYRHHYEGGLHLADKGEYLDKGPVEASDPYKARKGRSGKHYLNLCRTIVAIFKAHNWATAPTRRLPDFLQPYEADVDRKGTSINEFMRLADEHAQVEGHGLIMVDMPTLPGAEPLTVAAAEAANHRPYPVFYQPQHVINWQMKSDGSGLEWLVLRTVKNESPGPFGKYAAWTYITYWDATEFVVYKQKAGSVSTPGGKPRPMDKSGQSVSEFLSDFAPSDGWDKVAEGVNPFGEVPAFWIYNLETATAGLGESGIKDIAPMVNAHWNLLSMRETSLYDVGQPVNIVITDQELKKLGLGKRRGIRLQAGEDFKYVYLPPDAIEAISRVAVEIRQNIYRVALRRITEQKDGAQKESAEAKKLDREELISYCRERAQNLEQAEKKLWRLIAKGLGKDVDPGNIKVEYNRKFNTDDLTDQLKDALDIEALVMPSPTFTLAARMKVAKAYLGDDAKPKDLKKIEKELKKVIDDHAHDPEAAEVIDSRLKMLEEKAVGWGGGEGGE